MIPNFLERVNYIPDVILNGTREIEQKTEEERKRP